MTDIIKWENSESILVYEKGQEGLANKVAELSMNKMQSSLREFEKQKVKPLKKRLTELEEWTRKDEDRIYERIKKLEAEVKTLNKYISDCDKQRFDADEELIKRIDKLEAENKHHYEMHKDHYGNHERAVNNMQLVVQAQDDQVVRIEKLEGQRLQEHLAVNTGANIGLQNRIAALEQHKNYQIDENRKISIRVDEIQDCCASLADDIEKVKLFNNLEKEQE